MRVAGHQSEKHLLLTTVREAAETKKQKIYILTDKTVLWWYAVQAEINNEDLDLLSPWLSLFSRLKQSLLSFANIKYSCRGVGSGTTCGCYSFCGGW